MSSAPANDHGPAAGLEAERQALVDVSTTDAGRNLMRLFFLRQARNAGPPEHIAAEPAIREACRSGRRWHHGARESCTRSFAPEFRRD
jgi:hypothetical protein